MSGTEQLNLSIRWVSDHYKAHEGSVVFFVFLTLNHKLHLVQLKIFLLCVVFLNIYVEGRLMMQIYKVEEQEWQLFFQ